MPKPYSLDFRTTLPRKIRYNTPYFKFLKLKGKFNVQLLPSQEKTGNSGSRGGSNSGNRSKNRVRNRSSN
ncbi:hypothetical protein A6J50_05090 [Neisseria meningitidis]|nr:hypothetical protein A6J54_02515 [Neisseria meningitidis]ARC09821.1 hypothetical protein A6J50_05090 [Neisseria meningitidis]